jgi:hypothetical protein
MRKRLFRFAEALGVRVCPRVAFRTVKPGRPYRQA